MEKEEVSVWFQRKSNETERKWKLDNENDLVVCCISVFILHAFFEVLESVDAILVSAKPEF